MKKKIIIAGGSGFIGQYLAKKFIEKQYEVVILTRGKSRIKDDIKYVNWDAKTIGEWTANFENSFALINLTGKSVDCRYTEENKKLIINSRVDSTKILGKVVESLSNPPKIWFNSSTATIYESSLTQAMDEKTGIIGDDFSMNVAKKWEAAFYESKTPKTRKIALRISLVLGKDGGVVPVLKNLTKFFLGGKQGSGKQKFAWIHQEDVLRIINFCIDNENIKGAVNCASIEQIDNNNFMKLFRKTMNIPFGIPSPKLILQIGAFFLGTEPELVLKSRFVIPQKLIDSGFSFKYPKVEPALIDVLK